MRDETTELLAELMEARDCCESCGLSEGCRSPWMAGTGNPRRPSLAIVGEAPGPEEDRKDEPFVGATGKFLREMLSAVGIPEDEVWLTNAVRCHPSRQKPSVKQTRLCRDFLFPELEAVDPKVIIAAGNAPLNALCGRTGILAARGQWREWTAPSGKTFDVMPAAHPAYVLREPAALDAFLDDLADAWERSQGRLTLERAPVSYRVVADAEEFAELREEVAAAERIAWDIETTTVDPWRPGASVVCVQLSTRTHSGWLIPLDHAERPELEEFGLPTIDEFLAWLRPTLEDPPAGLRGQNLKFDSIYVRTILGIDPAPPEFDCFIAHHLLEEEASPQGGNGLKAMAWRYTDLGGYERAGMELAGGEDEFYRTIRSAPLECEDAPEKALSWYGCADTDVVLRVEDALRPRLEEEGLLEVLELELWKQEFLARIEERGAAIDWDYREGLMRRFPEQAKELARELRDFSAVREVEGIWAARRAPSKKTRKEYVLVDGRVVDYAGMRDAGGRDKVESEGVRVEEVPKAPEPFNLESSDQVRILCLEVLGLPALDEFKSKITGLPSCSKDAMAAWRAEAGPESEAAEILSLIERGKRSGKLFGTYIRPLADLRGTDGLIHTTYNCARVVTFRLSSSRPNLQNLPRDDDGAELGEGELGKGQVKRLFIPPHPDWWVAEIDYSQIELRIAALLSQDKVMLDNLAPGKDLHRVLAGRVFSKDPADITKPERSRAKGANFGYIYGISAKGLSRRLRISLDDADKFIKGCDRLYRGFVKWSDKMRREVLEREFTSSLFGHRRHLPGVRSSDQGKREEAIRQGINHPIQSTASNLTIYAGAEADELLAAGGFETRIFGTVHDSFWLTGPAEEKAEALALVKECMESQPFPWLYGEDARFPRVPAIIAEVEVGANLRDLEEMRF